MRRRADVAPAHGGARGEGQCGNEIKPLFVAELRGADGRAGDLRFALGQSGDQARRAQAQRGFAQHHQPIGLGDMRR
jgi:hypothetical protein